LTVSGYVTAAEIKAMMSLDRSPLFASDNLHTDGDNTLDVKMRPTATDALSYSITIAKTGQTLIIVKGMKDIPVGKINIKASDMMHYLRKSDF
uniref:Profilin n=1 Tax=Oncorhynchus mykiss TaxID=8022 RepID=A0A8K9XF85_ONCMY